MFDPFDGDSGESRRRLRPGTSRLAAAQSSSRNWQPLNQCLSTKATQVQKAEARPKAAEGGGGGAASIAYRSKPFALAH
jgi:hypothetical protein